MGMGDEPVTIIGAGETNTHAPRDFEFAPATFLAEQELRKREREGEQETHFGEPDEWKTCMQKVFRPDEVGRQMIKDGRSSDRWKQLEKSAPNPYSSPHRLVKPDDPAAKQMIEPWFPKGFQDP